MVRWNKAYIKDTKEVIGVDDERPIKVEYACMACGGPMIRRMGKKRIHHFAHHKCEKCNPESYFHKLGKTIFKQIYDESSSFRINTDSKSIDLKQEYGECIKEDREAGIILNRYADLNIKHLTDEDKDISVEILFTHPVSKKNIDKGYRIIEIRLPYKFSVDDITTSDEIETKIREVCTPPLSENSYIRFYNFDEGVTYIEEPTQINDTSSDLPFEPLNTEDCLGIDSTTKSTPNFRNYIQYIEVPEQSYVEKQEKKDELIDDYKKNENSRKTHSDKSVNKAENKVTRNFTSLRNEPISSTIYFEVSDTIKNKYPNIKHKPAVLPNYKQIIDIVLNNQYTFGIDYNKREVIFGDFERTIPKEWKEAVLEYIKDLKPCL